MIPTLENGRLEDGVRSIADKISKKLKELDTVSKYNKGRWVWELLQNAKDSSVEGKKVNVKIYLDDKKIVFSHTGGVFNELDVRGLINVITSKEVQDGLPRRKTGKFGTGFLTTHLLSKEVTVHGILRAENNKIFDIEFTINREANQTKDLIPQIEQTWKQLQAEEINSYELGDNSFNTSFTYIFKNETQLIQAKTGLEEFSKLLPYALVFNPILGTITIQNQFSINSEEYWKSTNIADNNITTIEAFVNDRPIKKATILAKYLESEQIHIAAPINIVNNRLNFESIELIPKIFCDFPLIGTEKFTFPVIINSFHLNPLEERNGIWLNDSENQEVAENKKLVGIAVQMYNNLIDTVSKDDNFGMIYNIINTKIPQIEDERYFDKDWYTKVIQRPLRAKLLDATIVENELGHRLTFKEARIPEKNLSIPKAEILWNFYFKLEPLKLCKKSEIQNWQIQIWNECTELSLQRIINNIEGVKNLFDLNKKIGGQIGETILWLNNFYKLILENEANLILFKKHKIIPNRNGIFLDQDSLRIDRVKDNLLFKIVELLGNNWNNQLLYENACTETLLKFIPCELKQMNEDITILINNKKVSEVDYNQGIRLLSQWFDNNSELGKVHFKSLYDRKEVLFMGTIGDKESLYNIMKKSTSLKDLSKIAEFTSENPEINIDELINSYKALTIIDADDQIKYKQILELLVAEIQKRGVKTAPELLTVLNKIKSGEYILRADINFLTLLPEERAKLAEVILAEAIEKGISHLISIGYKFIGTIDLNCPTVFKVEFKERAFDIIIRPAHGNKYKLYYAREFEVLKNRETQLWLATKDNAWEETLGNLISRMINEGTRFIPTDGFLPGRA